LCFIIFFAKDIAILIHFRIFLSRKERKGSQSSTETILVLCDLCEKLCDLCEKLFFYSTNRITIKFFTEPNKNYLRISKMER